MTLEPDQPTPVPVDASEPGATSAEVPVWLVVLFLMLLYWGMVYFDHNSGWFSPQVYAPYHSLAELQMYQPPSGGSNLQLGKAKYDDICALCHNTDGSGKPGQAPPFAGSEWVLGNPSHMVRIPLAGLSGPVQVKGQTWNLSMPAMGATLSDEELAAVLTYIRQSFGNKASPITPEQVKAIRAQVGNRSQPWTASELESVQ